MDVAYGCQESPSRIHTAKICIWAAWAFMSVFPGIMSPLSISQRTDIVTSLMASINLLQQPHIDLLQATSMLVIINLLAGNVQAGVLSNTLAARFVLLLGGNTRDCFRDSCQFVTTSDERHRPAYHLRNLFCMCYQQDKELCVRSGQPPAMSEYNCDLDLPIGYEQDYNISLGVGHCTSPVFPGDLRLSQIKSNVYCDLFSRRALEKDGVLILSDIRQLDRDLEEWRMSIPADYRPTLLFAHDTSHPPGTFSIRALMMRLEYYYCLAYIHQACGRFRSLAGNQDCETQGISSSLALSLVTCRSSLYCLLAVRDALSSRDFWLILFYPLSAILTIFCHIISDPHAPDAVRDLDLISKIAVHVRELGGREAKLGEGASNSDRVWKVITALEALGRRTIAKHNDDTRNPK
ncbi:uncharacterized protein N7511_004202 [Penicillium nucicola]|uniref:uncharacterized protein n=1 Tax=Penicillium nucicola TaxID=1850975 RepID=UPI002544D335|nr:uncharacterized protein N7511_004202 [Penicillium nucicola]KAJ5766586.1 hypothetical protein N7511_004202 [Penicillium nucicola]